MKLRNQSLCTTIGTVLLAHGLFISVTAQDPVADARRETAQLKKEIRAIDSRMGRTDSLMRQEAKRFTLLQQRIRDGIERRKSEIDTLNAQLAELSDEIKRLSGAIEQQRAGIRAIASRREYLTGQMIEHCEKLARQIRSSLPWNREERLSRVNALKSDLESGSAQIEDGFSRLTALLEEEITFGDEIVLDTRTVRRNDGSTVNARVIRLGNIWMAYIGAAEQQYGVLHREDDSTFIWNEDLDFAQREQIRTAIRVKESKKAPQIVSLPLKTDVLRKEDK